VQATISARTTSSRGVVLAVGPVGLTSLAG
jgi:hypothetical protein